ncbi:MAG: Single-stranded nucleic acid binding domain protein [Candidatus Saccharibacteria bacterium]|nr:Single-stranded nucleic acid binding domain protein [Candidatus Saccharibacteria bacterium]MDB5180417.1 Single-stranded nucleic acid binding domain protein [Candidatus Saccharibacteria bacterium]
MNRDASIEFARTYVADLLTFFGVNVDVTVEVEDDVIELSVPSTDLNSLLIGRNAETLRSLQYLVSTVLRNKDAALTRVNIDIADYKKLRAERLSKEARGWIEEVRANGTTKVVQLNAADRRVVHKVATEYSDIKTFSEGEGAERSISISQASS